MTCFEKWLFGIVLSIILGLVSIDIGIDLSQGVSLDHIYLELISGVIALVGILMLLKNTFLLKREIKEAEKWKETHKKYMNGLSESIDKQLELWQFTPAEKEVAFLLLKGFSLKEIANFRKTSEKTVRLQSTTLYTKAGLSGRAELSAFFLEDLLVP